MAVISITITDSPISVVEGIPQTVSISANISSVIFYTLDGTDPDTDSDIYIDAIRLPTDKANVTLKVFATNGVDSSAIISQTYKNTTFSAARHPRDKVIGLHTSPLPQKDLFPFGSNSPNSNVQYGNTGGITVDSSEIANIPDGYDGTATGTSSNGTDSPLTNYKFRYSTTNSIGETGPNIGTLPAQIRIFVPPAPPQTSTTNDKRLYNPRSLVIIQDGRDFDPDDVPLLNRPFFSSEDSNVVKNGVKRLTTGFEGNTPTGSFLRQHYNPREQTITYYYWDSANLKWIISIEPYNPRPAQVFDLSEVVFPPSNKGSPKVFKWIPFKRRVL